MAVPIPGEAFIQIPFPESGPWLEEGQSLNLGPFGWGQCSGNLFKTADNRLYVYISIVTWPGEYVADMPLHVATEGPSTLHIRWADKRVTLRQSSHPPVDATWKQPR